MKVIFLYTLIILAGTSVSPAYSQELLWESKESLAEGNKEPINAKIESLQWEAVTDTTRQLRSPSDNRPRKDKITWETLPYSFQREEPDEKNNRKKISIKSNHQQKKLEWITVTPETIIHPTEEVKNRSIFASTQEIQTALQVRDNNSPTYASSRALWRNDRWHPQISFLIPNGYGPLGLILEANATGTDCTLGKGPCQPFTTFSEWQESIDSQANGSTYLNASFGDTQAWGGILITNSLEQFASSLNTGGEAIGEENILTGIQTGLHYAKAIGPDTSFRTGVENLITWDSKDYDFSDMTRNFYFVGSQRFRLKAPENSSKWFRNLYLTAGIGNGEFKPIEQTFKDQTKALKDAGCQTYGFTPNSPCSQERFKRALRTGSDYGQMNPIGSISLEVLDGLHLISEWSGRNLNAGFSWRPFQDLGFIITPMVESIVRNCEYPGCRVTPIKGYPEKVALPDVVYTDRVRLSLQASFQIQF